jgi:hypothetical protein
MKECHNATCHEDHLLKCWVTCHKDAMLGGFHHNVGISAECVKCLMWYALHRTHCNQHSYHCCVCIHFHRNVFTELLPSNDRGDTQTQRFGFLECSLLAPCCPPPIRAHNSSIETHPWLCLQPSEYKMGLHLSLYSLHLLVSESLSY